MASPNEEKLCESIRKFPVLYDKREALYKDRNVVANAWKEVAKECGIEIPAHAYFKLLIFFDSRDFLILVLNSQPRNGSKGSKGANCLPSEYTRIIERFEPFEPLELFELFELFEPSEPFEPFERFEPK